MVATKVSEQDTLTIQERLQIASRGDVQTYDGSTVFDLTHLGFTMDEIYRLVAPRRTLARRIGNHQPLSVEENDSALRLVRIMTMAERVFGDPQIARDWLRKPNRGMQGIVPIDLLESETGALLVEQALHQIDFGIYV